MTTNTKLAKGTPKGDLVEACVEMQEQKARDYAAWLRKYNPDLTVRVFKRLVRVDDLAIPCWVVVARER